MKHVLITGASSGIGKALAIYYADKNVRLTFSGRDEKRLNDVADQCRENGADVDVKVIDVADKDAIEKWILDIDDIVPIDLVIANAGVSGTDDSFESAEYIFDINMNGVVNTIHPILPRMESRGHGQIALISSLAGYCGLASAPAYSASKNFVRAYGDALRGKLATTGVKINVVCPGFVRSRITDQNNFKMPGFMEADQAAKIIANGLDRNRGRIAFPWFMVWGSKFLSMLPYWIFERLVRKLPKK